jgi:hypothetical protein
MKIFANIWPADKGQLAIGNAYHRYWSGDGVSGANIVFEFDDESGKLKACRVLSSDEDRRNEIKENQNDN